MPVNIKVEYFGKLTDIARKASEVFQIDENSSIDYLESIVISRYNEFREETYILFLNDTKITDKDITLKNNDELCFMPLFSGG
jgi:molybdopterin converting factor small subunit